MVALRTEPRSMSCRKPGQKFPSYVGGGGRQTFLSALRESIDAVEEPVRGILRIGDSHRGSGMVSALRRVRSDGTRLEMSWRINIPCSSRFLGGHLPGKGNFLFLASDGATGCMSPTRFRCGRGKTERRQAVRLCSPSLTSTWVSKNLGKGGHTIMMGMPKRPVRSTKNSGPCRVRYSSGGEWGRTGGGCDRWQREAPEGRS